jgi:LmbE family N-acetylglucosaminyl deacetylase
MFPTREPASPPANSDLRWHRHEVVVPALGWAVIDEDIDPTVDVQLERWRKLDGPAHRRAPLTPQEHPLAGFHAGQACHAVDRHVHGGQTRRRGCVDRANGATDDCYVAPMEVGPLLVFSPHLDDAVLSLGNVIAANPGSIVVTVLAGMPDDETLATEWDAACGFDNAGDSMRARWEEDEAAVDALAATSIHLAFLDGQYAAADPGSISREIARIIEDHPSCSVYGPFGLIHADHILVSNAFLDAVSTTDRVECRLYADLPYYSRPGSLERRRAELEARGFVVGPLIEVTDVHAAKLRAREMYASQLRAIGEMPLDLPELPLDLPELTAVVRCTSRR